MSVVEKVEWSVRCWLLLWVLGQQSLSNGITRLVDAIRQKNFDGFPEGAFLRRAKTAIRVFLFSFFLS